LANRPREERRREQAHAPGGEASLKPVTPAGAARLPSPDAPEEILRARLDGRCGGEVLLHRFPGPEGARVVGQVGLCALIKGRFQVAGSVVKDGYAAAAHLHAQAGGQRGEARFGGIVRGRIGEGELGGEGGDVDDHARSARLHRGQDSLAKLRGGPEEEG